MLNKVQLIGRLGQDPELKAAGQTQVCRLNLASTENFKDKSGALKTSTEWHRVTVWGALGIACSNNLKKGSLIFVEGKLQTRSYEKDGVKQYATDVVAHTVKFLDKVDAGTTFASDNHKSEPQFNTSEDIPF